MSKVLKASEIPAGARLLGRQARALTGAELASGLVALVDRVAGQLAAVACEQAADRAGWAQGHLTYPRAKVEWCECPGGIWLRLVFGRGGAWDWQWESREADIREMRELGPFASPDDFREALGLARIAQFKLPSGEVVTAEMPGAALRPVEPKRDQLIAEVEAAYAPHLAPHQVVEKIDKQMTEAIEAVINPLTGSPIEPAPPSGGFVARFTEPSVLPAEELLAEPPSMKATDAGPVRDGETGKPIVNVAGKEPKFGKGSRKGKGASNGTN